MSPTPTLEQHLMWDDIAILLRFLLMLSFNNSLDGNCMQSWRGSLWHCSQGGHSPGEPGKQGKVRDKRKSQGKVRESVFLTQNVQKNELFTRWSCASHEVERRKDAYSARHKLCLKTSSLGNMDKQAVISRAKSSGHVRNVAEKSGNLIMTGEWPPCVQSGHPY